jgi:hypothetical protein
MTTANDGTENELWGPQRSRTVTWHDPGPGTARDLTMAGIDYLKAMIAGELPPPPMAALMQFDLVDAEPGKVVFTCRPDGSVYNPNGGVHGGLVCMLLDSVAGLAVHSTLPAGKGYTSIEIKVKPLVQHGDDLLAVHQTLCPAREVNWYVPLCVSSAHGAAQTV